MKGILDGMLMGLGLSILVGPLLIILITTSLESGRKAGILVGVGIWLSDIFSFSLTYLIIEEVGDLLAFSDLFYNVVGYSGAALLMIFGLIVILKARKSLRVETSPIRASSPLRYISRGFAINSFNPFTLAFWASVSGTVASSNDHFYGILFFTGILVVLIVTDSTKVLLADKVKRFLSEKVVFRIRLISGIILCLSALGLAARLWLGDITF